METFWVITAIKPLGATQSLSKYICHIGCYVCGSWQWIQASPETSCC